MENVQMRMENLQQRTEELSEVAADILHFLDTNPTYKENERERDFVLKALCGLQDAVDALAGGSLICRQAVRRIS